MSELFTIRTFVIERDIYARQAVVSYLSWDRRTRVVGQAGTPHELLGQIHDDPDLRRLDVIVVDTGLAANAQGLSALVNLLLHHCPDACLVCLAHVPDYDMALAAGSAGAAAYLVREQVGIGLASAVRFVLEHRFVVTEDMAALFDARGSGSLSYDVLPERRQYPRLTQRVEQALLLCVVEGLPAELAAEEMGVSTSTVRSYIKEGYRILEASDDTIYPPTMSPVERAFLRYSALAVDYCYDFDSPMRPAA